MNRTTTTLLLCLCFYGNLNSVSLGKDPVTRRHLPTTVRPTTPRHEAVARIKPRDPLTITKTALLDSISDLESKSCGDWKANNHNLYIGRYQVGPEVLRGQGYSPRHVRHIFHTFAKNPSVFPAAEQERTVAVWMGLVEEEMQTDIDQYTGKHLHGVRVTKAGILAASHRVGTVGVKYWLRRGHCRYTGRVNTTMHRYARTRMRETFKTKRTAALYIASL